MSQVPVTVPQVAQVPLPQPVTPVVKPGFFAKNKNMIIVGGVVCIIFFVVLLRNKTTTVIKLEKQGEKETTKEATKESTKEATKESTKEATKEPTKEATKESTKEATKEPTEEATKEPTEEEKKEDLKKVDAIKEELKEIEKTILGFRVKEGVSPIMDSLTASAAEVQDFVQNEVCAVINHDDAIQFLEKGFEWIDTETIHCKGKRPSVETAMVMLNENIDKMKKVAEGMTPEMKKLVMNLVKTTKNIIQVFEQQVCGDGKTEVTKEDVLKIVKNIRLSLCGHVEGKTSKKEAAKKIKTLLKNVAGIREGQHVTEIDESLPTQRILRRKQQRERELQEDESLPTQRILRGKPQREMETVSAVWEEVI